MGKANGRRKGVVSISSHSNYLSVRVSPIHLFIVLVLEQSTSERVGDVRAFVSNSSLEKFTAVKKNSFSVCWCVHTGINSNSNSITCVRLLSPQGSTVSVG